MKNYTTLILAGLVVVLAAALVGVLTYVKNQPAEVRTVEPLVEIAAMEPDSSLWGVNFPNQFDSFMKTETNNTDTTYAGSSQFSWLERDPRQVILFAGYPFSKDYNDDRGHANALDDVRATKRLNLDDSNPKHTPATCYSCKSSANPGLWDELGMEAYDAMSFNEMTPNINESIGCSNCHEAETMRLIATNPALIEALERQGKDWKTYTRQEMRSLVCANCHVEYYFKGDGKYLTFPWDNGTKVEEIISYYAEVGFKDWAYPDTESPMLKAQHPEYEFFTAGSTHYEAGVSCADCHMPYVRDGASKYSSHDVHSPLLNPEQACGQCHTDTDYVINRVADIQKQVAETKLNTEDAIIDAMNAIKAAVAAGNADATLLDEARKLHREAQFMWDFISAENSTGFHNPEYALEVLAKSADLARQAQMLAAQSVGDTSLLATGTYYQTTP
ncbi:MAG: ammonia-forming cytochrome c nitrite reductase subunit c552 [Chloroflexota bacterium]